MSKTDELKEQMVGLSLNELYVIRMWVRQRIEDVERREHLQNLMMKKKGEPKR